MRFDPDRHRRRSIRLPGYDYALPGAYFVTLVTRGRECLFGEVVNGEVRLTAFGIVIAEEWSRSARIRSEIKLDAFIVMPNHLHAIVLIDAGVVGAHGRAPLPRPGLHQPHRSARSLGSLIAGFKSSATKRINAMRGMPGFPVWQRNYYERVVRDEDELDRIRQYILDNPARWDADPENSGGPSPKIDT